MNLFAGIYLLFNDLLFLYFGKCFYAVPKTLACGYSFYVFRMLNSKPEGFKSNFLIKSRLFLERL